MLQTLLALEHAVLGLQQPFLRALRPETFWLLRLQLLHALLHAIDAVLTLCALARQHVTLPLLYNLLSLLDALLTPRRPRFDLFLSRRSRAHNGRCAWVRRGGDTWLRVSRHRWALRRRGAMDLGSRRCSAGRGWSWRGGDTRRRLRGHSWTLWRGSRTERRRRRVAPPLPEVPLGAPYPVVVLLGGLLAQPRPGASTTWGSSLLARRAGAHHYHGDTQNKYKANDGRMHDRNSLVLRRPEC